MTLAGIVGMCVFYLLPVLAPHPIFAGIGLFFTGTMIAFTNVSMNTCAAALEHQLKMHIMSTCHGLFSLGLMIGSLLSSSTVSYTHLDVYKRQVLYVRCYFNSGLWTGAERQQSFELISI